MRSVTVIPINCDISVGHALDYRIMVLTLQGPISSNNFTNYTYCRFTARQPVFADLSNWHCAMRSVTVIPIDCDRSVGYALDYRTIIPT
jgi:hypothetical protein